MVAGKRAILTVLLVVLSATQIVTLSLFLRLSPSSRDHDAAPAATTQLLRPPFPGAATTATTGQRRTPPPAPSDGTFSGQILHYRDGRTVVHSSVSCVGENHGPDAWVHRSCQLRHLCFNVSSREFLLYQSSEERAMEEALQKLAFASSRMNSSVAIGGVNTKRDVKEQRDSMRWFPRVVQAPLTEPYYELENDVIWIPFHSFFAGNVGHLIWDDFLPIYTLLRMFGLDRNLRETGDPGAAPSSPRVLLTRLVVEAGGRGLWATCDWTDEKRALCRRMFDKFLPLMGLRGDDLATDRDVRVNVRGGARRSDLVCAGRGAAGIGMLTDHGTKLHGWSRKDFEAPMHNHGRGALLLEFRNFMATNVLGDAPHQTRPRGPPYIITVSYSSSERRRLDFKRQEKELEKAYGARIRVQGVTLKSLSAEKQVRVAADTSIFVTFCGGGAVTAMFLPRGSSVLMYYREDGGVEKNKFTGKPAPLDWDIFNNMAWLRVHWMPAAQMHRPNQIDALVKLVGHELDMMMDEDAL